MQPNVEVSELGRREGINPTQYYGEKKQLLSSATKVFDEQASKQNASEERQEAELRYVFSASPWFANLMSGLLAYVLTSAPVWLGVIFGISFVPRDEGQPITPTPFLTGCSRFDGYHYR